ncbi:hypothetical protein CEXT_546421 [Caerostris extrusa]|uniref:Uncharacterized protein n=1 Tax=Caerostris extrusa TaxID=172846 RepID=A0AAV4N4U1_CAEEX|nr:hypothetical protein CEXT_546421 [Caerostris extrusa]
MFSVIRISIQVSSEGGKSGSIFSNVAVRDGKCSCEGNSEGGAAKLLIVMDIVSRTPDMPATLTMLLGVLKQPSLDSQVNMRLPIEQLKC